MAIAAAGITIPTTFEVAGTFAKTLPPPQLNIRRRVQLEDAWCYAACAAMAIKHVTKKTISQCKIAGFVKGNIDCCPPPTDNTCTNSGCRKDQIQQILTKFKVQSVELNNPISLIEVTDEINADRPIEVVIDWNGAQSSHAVVIAGFFNQSVFVLDPLPGSYNHNGWVTHTSLSFGFGLGTWVMTWRNLIEMV